MSRPIMQLKCGHCGAETTFRRLSETGGVHDCPNGCLQRVRREQNAGIKPGSCGSLSCIICLAMCPTCKN
jgi:hypothetical protein